VTAWAFRHWTSGVLRNRVVVPVFIVVACGLVFVLTGGRPGIVPVALLLVWVGSLVALWWRTERTMGRWIRRMRRLLARRPWRRVPVRLVRSGGRQSPVIELDDADARVQLRLTGAPVVTQHVLMREGRAWMVGPDDRVAVVRVDGMTDLIVGEVLAFPERESPVEPLLAPASSTGTAADDVVTSWVASRAVSAARRALAFRCLFRLCLPLAVLWFSVTIHALITGAVLTGLLLLLGVFSTVRECREGQGVLRLPELLRAGEWQEVPAHFEQWSPGGGSTGFAPAEGKLDGLAVVIPRASSALMAHAWQTGALCVAGRPEPGRAAAVGVTGYPVLAVAWFRA
jgi:hypothetical protein